MHLKEIYEFRSPHRDVIPRSTVGSSCWILFLFLMCHGWSRQVTSVENCWYWPGREKEEGISDGGNSCNQRGKVGKHKLLYQERQARNRLIYLVDISAWKAAEKFRFYTLHNGEPLVVFEVFWGIQNYFCLELALSSDLEEVHYFPMPEHAGPGLFCKLQVKLKLDVT